MAMGKKQFIDDVPSEKKSIHRGFPMIFPCFSHVQGVHGIFQVLSLMAPDVHPVLRPLGKWRTAASAYDPGYKWAK